MILELKIYLFNKFFKSKEKKEEKKIDKKINSKDDDLEVEVSAKIDDLIKVHLNQLNHLNFLFNI